MKLEKISNSKHPAIVLITEPSECGESYFLTNIVLNLFNEFGKIYIYSPSLHQNLYQKLTKCFTNYLPNHIIPNISNEKYIDLVIDELVIKQEFEKSDTEIETFESIEEPRNNYGIADR